MNSGFLPKRIFLMVGNSENDSLVELRKQRSEIGKTKATGIYRLLKNRELSGKELQNSV